MTEDYIDELRITAFRTNSEHDKATYYQALHEWFGDRHMRVNDQLTALENRRTVLEASREHDQAEIARLRKKVVMLEELLAFYEHAADYLDNSFPIEWEEAIAAGLRVVPAVASKFSSSRVTNLGADFVPIERLSNAEEKIARLRRKLDDVIAAHQTGRNEPLQIAIEAAKKEFKPFVLGKE